MPPVDQLTYAEPLIYDQAVQHGLPHIAKVVMTEDDYLAQHSYWGVHVAVRSVEPAHPPPWASTFDPFYVLVATPSAERLDILIKLADGVQIRGRWRFKTLLPRDEIAERLNQSVSLLDSLKWACDPAVYEGLRRKLIRWEKGIRVGRCGLSTLTDGLSEVQRDDSGAVKAEERKISAAIKTAKRGTPLASFYDGIDVRRPPHMDRAHHQRFCLRMHPAAGEAARQMSVGKHERLTVFKQEVVWTNHRRNFVAGTRYVLWIDDQTPPEGFGHDLLAAKMRREQLWRSQKGGS